MKTKVFLILLVVISAFTTSAQEMKKPKGSKALERIEQMETRKLIEILELKEETAVRFFARRSEYRNKHLDLLNQRQEIIRSIGVLLSNEDTGEESRFKEKLNGLTETEWKIFKEKENFYKSLSDLLSAKQILKLALFDERFRREVRETLMNYMRRSNRD